MRPDPIRLALQLLLLTLAATSGSAQTLRVEGDLDHPAAGLLRDIAATHPRIIDRDTLLPAGSQHAGDLVVIRSTVRVEGEITGRVAILDGHLFLRPGGRIGGPVVVGPRAGYFPSRNAESGDSLYLPTAGEVRLQRADTGYVVEFVPPPDPPRLRSTGLRGLLPPRYDRVDGATLRAGASIRLGRVVDGARLGGEASYGTERKRFGGALGLEIPLAGDLWIHLEGARRTVTNEAWIRGDVNNSLAALASRSDARDYHESDQLSAFLERRNPQPLIAGESFLAPRLGIRSSRDRSLEAGDPWSITDRDEAWRVNPPIDPGTILSAIAGARLDWRGRTAGFAADAAVEHALPASDLEFTQLVAEGRWTMLALWGHSIEIYGRSHHTFGDSPAPLQRWSFLGGVNTLPTFATAEMRGDRLAFVRSVYTIPLRGLDLPLLGAPEVLLTHATGAAWTTGDPMPDWEQNLGAGIAYSLLDAVVYVDPAADELDPQLSIGLRLPF